VQRLQLSKRKANTIANGLFLICLGVLFYTDFWWPGILIAIWILPATREFLTGRLYDLFITSAIFFGLFAVYIFHIEWAVLMPVMLVTGGIYIIFREYYFSDNYEAEKNIEIEKRIEETHDDK